MCDSWPNYDVYNNCHAFIIMTYIIIIIVSEAAGKANAICS